jgi:SHS2 domain-containing protein
MRFPPSGAPGLFREFEHTADIGIIVDAETPTALFEKAALATATLMVSLDAVEVRDRRIVEVAAEGWSELMQRWLTEIVALFALGHFVPGDVTVETATATRIRAMLAGERYDPLRHEFHSELKAVTYHELAVTQDASGWHARVIFDV